MFSDESTFQVFRVGSTKVRRLSSPNCYDPRYTVPTVKHLQSVMVWGAFSSDKGRVELFILLKNVMMNGDLYIKILSDHMVTMFELHQCLHFMHDRAQCHKVNKVTKWLQTKKIEALECPGNGPDLNLIEKCWHKVMSERKTTNLVVIKQVITNIWCKERNLEYFRKLIDSMAKLLQMVIKNKGCVTFY